MVSSFRGVAIAETHAVRMGHVSSLAGALLIAAGCGGAMIPSEDGEDTTPPNGSEHEVTAAPAATSLDVLYEGEAGPHLIAMDDRFLYWTTEAGLRQAPLAGGAPVTLAPGQYIASIVPFGEHVYFTETSFESGRVARVPRAGGPLEVLAEGASPRDLAAAGGMLYWLDPGFSTNTGRIFRALLDGSEPTLLAEGLAQPAGIALDEKFVYFTGSGQSCSLSSEGSFCSGGGIHRIPKAGGAPEQLIDSSGPGGMLLDTRGLYWFEMSPPRLMFAPLGGVTREVANVLVEGVGPLVSDSEALYWASGERVLRMPFESEVVATLLSDRDQTGGVAVRGASAYVAERAAGRILRVATDGSANRLAGPITGPCPEPLGSLEELAATPRADENLELLALSLERGALTVRQSTYDRVVADVTALRVLAPGLAEIGYFPPHDGKSLYVGWTELAGQAIVAGEYSAWDCLNERYGATVAEPDATFGRYSTIIALRGIYDTPQLAELYAELPGATAANADSAIGDGPTLCAARDGERYEYVVDRAGGDCPAGCTEHEAFHFTSDSAGQVTASGEWQSGSEPAPTWFSICAH